MSSWAISEKTQKIRASWSVRVIFKNKKFGGIAALRQNMEGEKTARHELAVWINAKGLKGLQKEIDETFIDHASDKDVIYRDGDFVIMGNPRASYGYLYIDAWMDDENG